MPRRERSKKRMQLELQTAASKCSKLDSFLGFKSTVTEAISVNVGEDNDQRCDDQEPEEKPIKFKCKLTTLLTWKADWSWLGYEEDNGYVTLVWCDICRDFYGEGGSGKINQGQVHFGLEAYVKGTTNVKKDTVRTHNASRLHQAAVNANKHSTEVPAIYRQFEKMDEETFTRICRLFDWAYTVAYCELPFTSFPTFIGVEKKHGIPLGHTYTNDKACRAFIEEIGATMSEELKIMFNSQPFYCSILFDGSTDKTISEKEVISVKLLENGFPKIKLLGIAEPAQTTSEGIFTAISDKIKDMNLDIDSCIAVAADGASVNFGKNTGVLSRLHAKLPWLIQMHCVSHRLELALKDAFKDTFYAVEIDNLMMQLYYMYRRSVKKWNELKKTAEAFGEHVVKPSRAQGTRWIDHRRKALRALVQDYRCLVAQFQEQGSELRKDVPPGDRAKMRGYAKLMTSQHFVLYLASYQDLVEELAHLSLTLQDEKLPVSSVRANVEVTQANLKLMIERPGRNLRNVLNESSAGEDGVLQVHQTQLTSSIHDVESFHNNSKKTIQKITNCLTSRFANFTENEVLSAAEILDPANIPTQAEAQVTYGLKEVDLLVHHFEQLLLNKGCNIEEVEREWQRIKYDIARNHKQETFYQLWQKMLTEKHERYSNFLHLVRILLVCPVATAQVERQFSTIKRILGDWRLGLGVHTIEHLLRICSEGPEPAHFVPEPAVHRWRTSSVRSRRPHTFPYGQRTDTDSATQPAHFEE